MLYQTNVSGTGQTDVTPIPDLGFKSGVSYEDTHGLSIGLFLTFDEGITGYSNAVNVQQGSHNVLNGDLRYDLGRLFRISEKNRIALVAHANNITNHPIWLPSWGFTSVDTMPVEQGAVFYAGLQFSAGKK